MTDHADDTLHLALTAARTAAPSLDRAALDAAVTAATAALTGEVRSLQVALRISGNEAVTERSVLTSAQLWVAAHDGGNLKELKAILGGHTKYGFEPSGVTNLDPVTVAEAATEAYLREHARAERLEQALLAASF